MDSVEKSLNEILDSFIELVQGKTKPELASNQLIQRNDANSFCENQEYPEIVDSVYDENSAKPEPASNQLIQKNEANSFCENQEYHGIVESLYDENSTEPEPTSNQLVKRDEANSFCENQEYHGIVESIYDENSAVVVVAQRNDGRPLQIHEIWNKRQVFARVLLTVDRFYPSENEPVFPTEISDIVGIGDVVVVKFKVIQDTSNSLFHYFAEKGFKLGVNKKYILEDIKDPLSGIVDNIYFGCSNQVGIIKFMTYTGVLAKAAFTIENVHFNGKKCKEGYLLNSFIVKNDEVHLDVKKWETHELKNNWEKSLNRKGVKFLARNVWLKDNLRQVANCHNDVHNGNARTDTGESKIIQNRRKKTLSHQQIAKKGEVEVVNMNDEACSKSNASGENEKSKNCNGSSKKSNRREKCFVSGTLISVDENWGLVKTEDKTLVTFKSDIVFLYGLNIDGLPLQKIIFRVHRKEVGS